MASQRNLHRPPQHWWKRNPTWVSSQLQITNSAAHKLSIAHSHIQRSLATELNWAESGQSQFVYSRSIYQVSKSKATGNQLNSSNKLKLTNLTTYNCRTARILKKQTSSSFYFSLKQHNLLIYLLGREKGVPETCWWKFWWLPYTQHHTTLQRRQIGLFYPSLKDKSKMRCWV